MTEATKTADPVKPEDKPEDKPETVTPETVTPEAPTVHTEEDIERGFRTEIHPDGTKVAILLPRSAEHPTDEQIFGAVEKMTKVPKVGIVDYDERNRKAATK